MRRGVRFLAGAGRWLGRWPLAASRLGRWLAAVGRLGRRLAAAGPLDRWKPAAGWLGRRPLAIALSLAGTAAAVGMGAGSAEREGERSSRSGTSARAVSAPTVVSASAAPKLVGESRGRLPRRGGAAYYRRTALSRVPAEAAARFVPLYREAERVYGVNWLLIASIHQQETAFSTAPSTYHGLNDFGCCAGPMQFNVTNGPVTTWELYRQAFRAGRRPKRYPHRTRSHPSVYDDFDAIMAAGSLLRDSGAGSSLDSGAWSAAYDYYGHDLYGVTYASQVLARAVSWERDGFCPDCPLDEGLVSEFDNAYGASVRRELLAAERRSQKRKRQDARRRREGKDSRDRARTRRARGRRQATPPSAKRERPTKRSRPRRRPRRNVPARPSPPPPEATQPSPTPPTTAPPPADRCSPLLKLLGCRS